MRRSYATVRMLIIAMIGLLLSLSGCGTTSEDIVTITMASGAVGNEFQVLQAQVARFEAQHPNIKVELFELPESTNDRRQTYLNLFEAQDPSIDVLIVDIIWPPEFGANGWTLPLNEYVAAHDIDTSEFLEGTVQGNTWQGQLVSIPWFTDAGLLYYRSDLLEKYGYEPPETWAELVTIAEAIVAQEKETHPEMVGFVFQGREYEGLVTNYLEYVWSNGGDVLSEDGTEVVLDSPQAVEALKIFTDMREIAPLGITAFQEADGLNYFRSGNAVFMRNWPFAWAALNAEDSAVQGQVGIAPLPRGPQGTESASTLGGWELGISAYSEHPDEAFELIKFLTSEAEQNYKAIHAAQNPTRKSAYENREVLTANPHLRELYDVVETARPRPPHPEYNSISLVIQQEVHKALRGEQDAATATAIMAAEIQRIIDLSAQEANTP